MTNYDVDEEAPDEGSCFSNKTKDCCKKFIIGVSVVALIIGAVLAGYGYTAIDGTDTTPGVGSYKTEFKVDKNVAGASLAMAGGVLAVLISCLGFLTAYCRNPLVTCPFGICSFIVGILALAVAGVVFANSVSQELYKKACETSSEQFGGESGVTYMKKQYSQVVDDIMCTTACPCDQTDFNAGGFQNIEATKLLKFGTGGRANGAATSPVITLTTQASGAGVYKKYEECYKAVVDKASFETSGNAASVKEFVKNGGYAFMKDLESKFKCAGVCY